MGLNPINGGLRRLHYDAKSTAKVDLRIKPGDVLEVSDDVASQLMLQSAQFKDQTHVADEPAETPAKRRRKRGDKDDDSAEG